MGLTGVYLPGSSPVHRTPAGVKIVALAVVLLVLAVLRGPTSLAVTASLLLILTVIARVPPRAVFTQVRPVLWVAAAIAAFQVWAAGPLTAVVVVGSLLVAVAGAGLVTLTTRTQDLLDAVVAGLRPLRRLGVDPERAGLVLALAVRSVPVLTGLAREVHEARVARGASRSVRALAVPLVIRAVRHADRLGEALAARGVDDP